jgi:four helix bundle protein
MIKNFLAYDLAIQLQQQCEAIKAKSHYKNQLDRASLSVVLNLAEGSGKPTKPEQRRFFGIALGSLRETQAILQILNRKDSIVIADRLGGMLYRLVHPK